MDLDSVLVHKHAKKELGQYPSILTSRLVNNPYRSPWQALKYDNIRETVVVTGGGCLLEENLFSDQPLKM